MSRRGRPRRAGPLTPGARPERSDASLNGTGRPRPVLVHAYAQAAHPQLRGQLDREAIETVEREDRPEAQQAALEDFDAHQVAGRRGAAGEESAARLAQVQRERAHEAAEG